MNQEPLWLNRQFIDAAHSKQLQEHGGLPGTRDENALESALARPQNLWSYEPDTSLFKLAAAYCFGIAKAHGYVDGNKRAAFAALYTFLLINDWEVVASQLEVVEMILAVASSSLDEEGIERWLKTHTKPFQDEI